MPTHFCLGLEFVQLFCNMKLLHCHGRPGHLRLTLQDLVLTPAHVTYFKSSRWSKETVSGDNKVKMTLCTHLSKTAFFAKAD